MLQLQYMLFLSKSIFKWVGTLTKISKDPQKYSLATIHAAIISILVTSIFAYLIFLNGRIVDLNQSVFFEADKINTIPFWFTGPGSYDSSKKEERIRILIILDRIASYGDTKVKYIGKIPDVPKEKEARGSLALDIMWSISSNYPFLQKVFRNTPKQGQTTFKFEKPKKSHFNDIQEIEEWINDIETLSIWLERIWTNHRGNLIETVRTMDELTAKANKLSSFSEHVDFTISFFENVKEARKISDSTRSNLRALQTYQSKLKIKRILGLCLVLCFISFISGVIYQIVDWEFMPKTMFWLPFLLYFIVFLSLFLKFIF